ncbi:DUF3857 domain-containing protein [Flavobacteriaceae bacterium TK19130]|nr:DUF3857 domain-containing protein [Thermobacterium salinum]
MPHKFVLLVLILFSSSLFAQDSQYNTLLIPSKLKEKANSVTWEETYEVDVRKVEEMTYRYRTAVAVLNKLGANDVSTYTYYDDDTKIKNIEIWVYDAMGNEIEHYKERDFDDISAHDGISIYNDDRALYLDYTPTTYPYTLVFESETESNTTAFLPTWRPIWGYYTGTKSSTYTLRYDPANKPRYLSKNLSGFDISVIEEENRIVCSAKEIAPIVPEAYSLSHTEIVPHIAFQLDEFYLKGVKGNGRNWKELGSWMEAALLSDGKELPESTISHVKSLVANEATNIGKAKIVYNYLQNKVRYISIQVGIGGWKPMPAADVDRLGYGDCKALTFYTKTLLEAVGVPSYYTVLYAGDQERDLNPEFSGIMGNHVILGIPEGDEIIWLECTSQLNPFGFGGKFSDDRDVMVITPEGGTIVHTKKYSAEESYQHQNAEIEMTSEGGIQGVLTTNSGGLQYDDKFHLETYDKEELDASYKNRWGYINGLFLNSIHLENDKQNIQFKETIDFQAPNFASKVGDGFLLTLNVFNRSIDTPPRSRNRRYGFKTATAYQDIDSISITLPKTYRADALPEPVTIENVFGSYELKVEEGDNRNINVYRLLTLHKASYSKESYSEFRKFLRNISRYDNSKILVIRDKTPLKTQTND